MLAALGSFGEFKRSAFGSASWRGFPEHVGRGRSSDDGGSAYGSRASASARHENQRADEGQSE